MWYKYKMNIKLVHILTEPDDARETASIRSLAPLGAKAGMEYIMQLNERYHGDDWKDPAAITFSEATNHGPGHYGAFQSFKKAIIDNFTDDIDALMLCECDCILETDYLTFIKKVEEAIAFADFNNLAYLSLGDTHVGTFLQSPILGFDDNYPDFYITNKIILAHCIMLPQSSRNIILNALDKLSWDSPDIWFNEAFWTMDNRRFGIIKKKLASQHEGISLIDNVWRDKK